MKRGLLVAIFVFSVLIVGMPTFFASAAETANNNENTYQSCTTSAGTTGYVSPSTGHCVPSMDAGKKEVLPCPSGQQYDASGICVASTASTTNSTGATGGLIPVSYTHLRAHETDSYLVCRL